MSSKDEVMEYLEQLEKELCDIYEKSPQRYGLKVGTWKGIPIEKFSKEALLGLILEMGQLHKQETTRSRES